MAGFALAIILLIGLAIYSLSRMQAAPWTSSLPDPTIEAKTPRDLPQFEHDEGSRHLSSQQFAGNWTLLSFWSITCAPCLIEMPSLNQLNQSWAGPELQIMTINVDEAKTENLEAAKAFLSESGIELTTYFDSKNQLANAFGVTEYPKHFLVGPDGKIIWEASGAFRWTEAQTRDQLIRLMERQAPELPQDPVE